MFKVNLRGQVRQTNLPKWKPLLPLFEAVMNSLQAVQERADASRRVVIAIERAADLFGEGEPPVYAFTVSDNGSGFNDENFDSFNTAFSDYKMRRGGKGLGRFTWLKAFERVEIDSTYPELLPPETYGRKFTFDENYDPDLAPAIPAPSQGIGTTVRLVGFLEPYRSECPKSGEQIAQKLVEHFLLLFLQPDCPTIEIHDGGIRISANDVFHREFRASATMHNFDIHGTQFTLHGFRLGAPRNSRHRLTYAAHDRAVLSENLEEYIPNLSGRLTDPSGEGSFVYMAVVQSSFLNQKVNHSRTDFEIASIEEIDSQATLFDTGDIGRSEIRAACVQYAESDLSDVMSSINASKEERVHRLS